MSKIKVILKEPMKNAQVMEIENTLEKKQKAVGGWLEYVPFGKTNLVMYANEEGKLERLEPNLRLNSDIVVGNVLITKIDENGDDVDLNEKDIDLALSEINKIAIVTAKESQHYKEILSQYF